MSKCGLITITKGYFNRNKELINFFCSDTRCNSGINNMPKKFGIGDTVFKRSYTSARNCGTYLYCLNCAVALNYLDEGVLVNE